MKCPVSDLHLLFSYGVFKKLKLYFHERTNRIQSFLEKYVAKWFENDFGSFYIGLKILIV